MKGATFNASTTIVFKIGADDKDEVAALFNTTPSAPEIQREEMLIPRQNVVAHLINYGHESKEATDFITRYLAPLELAAKQQPRPHDHIEDVLTYPYIDYPDDTRYRYKPTHIQKGLLALNDILYSAMLPERRWITKELEQMNTNLCYFLGYPHFFLFEKRKESEKLPPEEDVEKKFLRNAFGRYFGLTVEKHLPKWPKEVPYRPSTFQIFLRLLVRNFPDFIQYPYPDLFFFWYTGSFNMPVVKEGAYVPGIGYINVHDLSEVHPLANRIRDSEYERFRDFTSSLADTAGALSKTPIYKGSGHWIEKSGIRQTHADKQNEIGNALTHLARFTAWVKIGNKEYTIATYPLPPRRKVSLSDLIHSIRQRNVADGYLRPVSEVKDELRKRRDDHEPPFSSKQKV
jgi:hypothetical protein